MLQETVVWLTTISSLACMVKAWQETRKAITDLRKLKAEERQKILDDAKIAEDKIEAKAVSAGQRFVIHQEILDVVVADINNAQDRFIKAVKDTNSTTSEIDEVYKKTKHTICIHLQKIKELNKNNLPTDELKLISESWCE